MPERVLPRVRPDLGDPDKVVSVVFGCRPDEVAEAVVITPFVPLKAFRHHIEQERVTLSPPFFYKGFTAEAAGERVSVIHTGVGPSRVGDCLGFLALTPARRVVFAGAVGGLNQSHRIGEYFFATGATNGEGYTRYVQTPFADLVGSAVTVPCDGQFHAGTWNFLAKRGWKVHRGALFTVGCITCESRQNLEILRDFGHQAVEMELSAFFAAARHHGIEAAALTYISDLPLRTPLWADKDPAEQQALRKAYRALPNLALEYLREA